jgi:hypothetical protein
MAKHEMNPETVYPPSAPEYSLTGDALRNEQVQGGGVGTAPDPAGGMKRYPTEDPAEVSSSAGASTRRMVWSAAGALAGAAAAMIGMKLARRR